MRLGARKIAIMAVAFLLVPTLLVCAEDVAKPAARANTKDVVVNSLTRASAAKAALAAALAADAPASPAPQSSSMDTSYPKADLFLGYSGVRAVPTTTLGNRMVWLSGGTASIAYNLNRYFGLVADFGGYRDTLIRLTGTGANPPRSVDSTGSAYTLLFGPRLSLRKYDRITPFAQALFGVIHASKVTTSSCSSFFPSRPTVPGSCTPLPTENAFAMTAGGGLDVKVHHHIAIRIIQAEYMMTRFADLTTGIRQRQDDVRLSAGIVFSFGGERPEAPPPPAPTPPPPPPPPPPPAPAVESQATRPPTLSCSADRSSGTVGESVQITASANSPDNFPLTYSWSASGGQIVGSGSSVRFDTTGVAPGQYTVSGHVDDAHGGVADCSVNVEAQAPPVPPEVKQLEQRLALHSIYFQTDRPKDDVDGIVESQQEVLSTLADDFKRYLTYKPDAHLNLEGHCDSRGSVEYNQALGERRVERTKSYLIEHGVPAGSIQTESFGKQQELDADQVRQLIEKNPELSAEERQKILGELPVLVLANNRRVDVTLSTTGEQSVREYPFNARDYLSLVSPRNGGTGTRPRARRKTKTK